MFKKLSLPFLAFIQVTLLVLYIVAVVSFLNFIIPTINTPESMAEFYAPILMLILFVVSAVFSATIVLGRAAYLFWEKKYKESFIIILWTVIWGFIYFSLFVSYLIILSTIL